MVIKKMIHYLISLQTNWTTHTTIGTNHKAIYRNVKHAVDNGLNKYLRDNLTDHERQAVTSLRMAIDAIIKKATMVQLPW